MCWKGICSPNCWTAKTDKKYCKCKCHGAHHGAARSKAEVPELNESPHGCPKSLDGMHHIPRGPPSTKEECDEWRKLSESEKEKSQFCVYCGKAIW